MKLSEKITALIGDPKSREAKAIRTLIALRLNFTEAWVGLRIKQNKENGPLTTMAAVEVIRKETGWDDEDILDRTPDKVRA